MRARFINENIDFERGGDPKSKLGVGKVAKAKEMLEREFGDRDDHFNPYTYKIHSLDNIEIRYSDKFREDTKGAKRPQRGIDDVWILKYSEIDQFVPRYYTTTEFNMSNHWVIDKRYISWHMLSNMEVKSEQYMSIYHDKEETEVIAKALNEHYGPAVGFELVEKIKEEDES